MVMFRVVLGTILLIKFNYGVVFIGYCEGRNFIYYCNFFSGCFFWIKFFIDCWGEGGGGKRFYFFVNLELK